MAGVTFNRSSTLAAAKTASNYDEIFFPTDSDVIVMGRKEYGATTDVKNRITTLEGQVPTAAANAQSAADSADAAAAQAQNAANSLAALQTAIQSLPSGSDVSAAVALMKTNKVEIVDLRSISSGDTIKDSFNTAIEAGKCLFVYGNGDQSAPRYFGCETVSFTYNSTYYTVAKFKVGTSQGDDTEYRYWVFTKNASYDMWQCSALYNENNVPSYIKEKLASEIVKTKANKPSSYTNGHIAGLNGSGNLFDCGIKAGETVRHASVNDSGQGSAGTTSKTISSVSGIFVQTGDAFVINPKESVKFIDQSSNSATYVLNSTASQILASSNYGEVNYTNNTNAPVKVKFGASGSGDTYSYSIKYKGFDEKVTEIEADIAAKYTKPGTGIPYTDLASGIPSTKLASAVQTSLGKADTSLQEITQAQFDAIFEDW